MGPGPDTIIKDRGLKLLKISRTWLYGIGLIVCLLNQSCTYEWLPINHTGQQFTIERVRQLTFSPSTDFSTSWHPDSSRLAFVAHPPGNWPIWIINRDGSKLRRFLGNRARHSSPTWSPDGRTMLFSANRTSNLAHLWLLDLEQQTFEELTHDPNSKDLLGAWSPNGEQIAYLAFAFGKPAKCILTILDLQRKQTRVVTDDTVVFSTPAWSPDGREIAFTSTRSGNEEIWAIDPEGKGLRQLTHHPGVDEHPTWNPDGSAIAFASDQSGYHEIWVMDRFGRSLQQLTHHRVHNSHPTWSPDGTTIAYVSNRAGNDDIWILELESDSR